MLNILKLMPIICIVWSSSVMAQPQLNPPIHQEIPPLTFEKFLELRSQPDVVILDAAQLEKYFMVVPESMGNQGKGLTQAQLDTLLASVIPTKETKVILYCHQTFQPTRMMAANRSIAISLMENGYKNVQNLEDLWRNGSSLEGNMALELGQKQVIPYAKKIPENYPVENKSE